MTPIPDDLVDQVCNVVEGLPSPHTTDDLARAVIPLIAKRERERVLADLMGPSDAMLLAANGATAGWLNVQGSQLTVNKAKHKARYQAMLHAYAREHGLQLEKGE